MPSLFQSLEISFQNLAARVPRCFDDEDCRVLRGKEELNQRLLQGHLIRYLVNIEIVNTRELFQIHLVRRLEKLFHLLQGRRSREEAKDAAATVLHHDDPQAGRNALHPKGVRVVQKTVVPHDEGGHPVEGASRTDSCGSTSVDAASAAVGIRAGHLRIAEKLGVTDGSAVAELQAAVGGNRGHQY